MSTETFFTVVVFNSLVLFVPIAVLLLYLRPQLWHYLFASFLGLVIGWIDIHSVEIQPTVLLLLVFGLFLGFAQPRHAWRWALLLAIWVPLGGCAAQVAGLRSAAQAEPGVIASFIAFIPALVGAYGGMLVNRAAARTTREAGATGSGV